MKNWSHVFYWVGSTYWTDDIHFSKGKLMSIVDLLILIMNNKHTAQIRHVDRENNVEGLLMTEIGNMEIEVPYDL